SSDAITHLVSVDCHLAHNGPVRNLETEHVPAHGAFKRPRARLSIGRRRQELASGFAQPVMRATVTTASPSARICGSLITLPPRIGIRRVGHGTVQTETRPGTS